MAPRRRLAAESDDAAGGGACCGGGGCCGGGDGGCCGADRSAGAVRGTVALGLSFILLVVAGAVYKDFLPFINVAFVVLLPVAVIIGDMYKAPKFLRAGMVDERVMLWGNFAAVFLGLVLVSMFALPLVLLHIQALTPQGFALWMASTVISAASAIFFFFARQHGSM